MKIKDAVVLVTGANRGLGRALVQASLQAGARRVYAGARDPKQLDGAVRASSGKVVPVALDIDDPRSLAAAAAFASDVTVLVNNAGVLASYNLLSSTPEQIAQDFTTNVFGTLGATKAFLPALERAGAAGAAGAAGGDGRAAGATGGDGRAAGAALVNVLSVVSLASMPALGAYSASKAAAFSLTQALRGDLAKKGIAVHAVLAGSIDTDMVRAFDMPKTSAEQVAKGILEGVEQGLEDILPDPMSRELHATWKRDPKELERRLASMSG